MKTPRNEIELLDISFEGLLERYQPLVNNFARTLSPNPTDQEDYRQEAAVVLWQAHHKWVRYQDENNVRERGHTKGSFTSFAKQRLEWKQRDIFRKRQEPYFYILDDHESMVDGYQQQELEDTEFLSSFSPNAVTYLDARLNGTTRKTMCRRDKDAAIKELNTWRAA